ncbi:MAG: hypothetical protein ACO20Y_08585 [Poseidonia sp.]
MGRPRKQPRRIVTFNLNLPLAEAIDNLPVKNRSEWANTALQAVLDNRLETTKEALAQREEDARYEAENDLMQAIADNPVRALNIAINALEQADLQYAQAKGRFPVVDHLTILRNALITGDRLKGMD